MKLLGLNSPEIFIILVVLLSILGTKRIEKGFLLFKKVLKFLLSKEESKIKEETIEAEVKSEESEESKIKEETIEAEVKSEESEESKIKEETIEAEVKSEESEESKIKEETIEAEVKSKKPKKKSS